MKKMMCTVALSVGDLIHTDVKRSVLASIGAGLLASTCVCAAERVESPYADVQWDKTEYLHSFSHQHGHNPQVLWDMGYRHLPLSNYYPSKPFYPLPEAFSSEHPDAIGGPNAEQHSVIDMGIHFNVLGSLYATGYGHTPRIQAGTAPVEYVFEGLTVSDSQKNPGSSVYRLDLGFAPTDGAEPKVSASLTVEGAIRVEWGTFARVDDGMMQDFPLTDQSPQSFYLKAQSDRIRVKIDFDPVLTKIARFRMMQGVNRPWRDAFRSGLDGKRKDAQGNPVEGLLYPDAGGITINHPNCGLESMLTMLDFDDRVLGHEIWNHRRLFGASATQKDAMGFYNLWDDVLRTGRRCFGFFVKDHYLYGRGRNVLLVPDMSELTAEEREREALLAYRQGRFFGLIGAMSVDASGKVVPPYDNSAFRFTRIAVRQDQGGVPSGLEVVVGGADQAQRPNTQIRFVTDQGVVSVANSDTAFFAFPRGADGSLLCRYVRAEAFAYPDTHLGGEPLTQEAFSTMNVSQIVKLHDTVGDISRHDISPKGQEPIGIVDMLFSQPILIRE